MLGVVRRRLQLIVRDRAAVTALEYALIAAFLAILLLVGASRIGASLSSVFLSVAAGL